jgi:hypothetical protein
VGTAQGPVPKPIDQCRDVQDVLEQVRLRPSQWIRHAQLRELQTILFGYSLALTVHGMDERFDLGPVGPFAEWLQARRGWSMSMGWADAIAQHAGAEEPLTVFFRLFDDYRASLHNT